MCSFFKSFRKNTGSSTSRLVRRGLLAALCLAVVAVSFGVAEPARAVTVAVPEPVEPETVKDEASSDNTTTSDNDGDTQSEDATGTGAPQPNEPPVSAAEPPGASGSSSELPLAQVEDVVANESGIVAYQSGVGDRLFAFAVLLDRPAEQDIELHVSVRGVSATPGRDYSLGFRIGPFGVYVPFQPLRVIATGESVHYVFVVIKNDSEREENETLELTVTKRSGNVRFPGGASSLTATLTIVDHDNPRDQLLSIDHPQADATIFSPDAWTDLVWGQTAPRATVRVTWRQSGLDLMTGSTQAERDGYWWVFPPSFSNLPYGELEIVASAYVYDSASQEFVTVTETRHATRRSHLPLAMVSPLSPAAIEEGANAAFLIELSPYGPQREIDVGFVVSDSYHDYLDHDPNKIPSSPATLKYNMFLKKYFTTVRVPTVNDNFEEADGSVTLTLRGGTNNYNLGVPRSATVAVQDNDQNLPVVSVRAVNTNVLETDGSVVEFEVSLDQPTTREISVGYVLGGKAKEGVDYHVLADDGAVSTDEKTLVFQPSDDTTPKRVRLGIIDDDLDEANEEVGFIFALDHDGYRFAQGGLEVLFTSARIIDYDPVPYATIGALVTRATEGNNLEFKVSLDKVSGRDVRVKYRVNSSSDAEAGLDFEKPTGFAKIKEGEKEGIITIKTTEDTDEDEQLESVIVELVPGTSYAFRHPQRRYGYIRNKRIPRVALVGFEVTQGTQDWQGSVDLVRDRATVVRAFFTTNAAGTTEGVEVGATLKGWHTSSRGDIPLGSIVPNITGDKVTVASTSINPNCRADTIIQATNCRADIDSSLNFLLPNRWTSYASLRLTLEFSDDLIVTCDAAINGNKECSDEKPFSTDVEFVSLQAPTVVMLSGPARLPQYGYFILPWDNARTNILTPRRIPIIGNEHRAIIFPFDEEDNPLAYDENGKRIYIKQVRLKYFDTAFGNIYPIQVNDGSSFLHLLFGKLDDEGNFTRKNLEVGDMDIFYTRSGSRERIMLAKNNGQGDFVVFGPDPDGADGPRRPVPFSPRSDNLGGEAVPWTQTIDLAGRDVKVATLDDVLLPTPGSQELLAQWNRVESMLPFPNQDFTVILEDLSNNRKFLAVNNTHRNILLKYLKEIKSDHKTYDDSNSIFAMVIPGGTGGGIARHTNTEDGFTVAVWEVGFASGVPESSENAYFGYQRNTGAHEIGHALHQLHTHTFDNDNNAQGFCAEFPDYKKSDNMEYPVTDIASLRDLKIELRTDITPKPKIKNNQTVEVVHGIIDDNGDGQYDFGTSEAVIPQIEEGRQELPLLGPLDYDSPNPNTEVWGLDIHSLNNRKEFGALGDPVIVSNPRHVFAIMSYCSPGGQSGLQDRWLDRTAHGRIVEHIQHVNEVNPPAGASGSVGVVQTDYFFGAISFSEVDGSATGAAVNRIYSRPRRPSRASSGDYVLELRDQAGTVLRSYSFETDEVEHQGSTAAAAEPGYFDMIVPSLPDYASFAVKLADKELLVRQRSVNAPAVSVSGITANRLYLHDETIELAWSGSDADAGDELSYRVYYSTDGGASYGPLRLYTINTEMSIDVGQLAGSDNARLAVSVSDGTRSAFTETPVFKVAGRAPEVEIRSSSGAWYGDRGFVLFASGYDYEDGVLGLNSFNWHSSLDGELGTGEHIVLSTDDLTEGEHLITLTGTDRAGMTGTDTITITTSRTNTIPQANDDTAAVGLLEKAVLDVLANDTDTESDINRLEITAAPTLGTAMVGYVDFNKLVIRYDGHTSGTDSFTYQACDGIDRCSAATVTISVGLADCTITGTTGNDTLHGTAGNDIICALDGNDIIYAYGGADIIRGGQGDDTIYGNSGDDTIHGGLGNDYILAHRGADTVYGGPGQDRVYGGSGNDQLHGGAGADQLYGEADNDTIDGNEGNDLIQGGRGNDTLRGGLGDDTIRGNAGADTMHGGIGANTFPGATSQDTIIQMPPGSP